MFKYYLGYVKYNDIVSIRKWVTEDGVPIGAPRDLCSPPIEITNHEFTHSKLKRLEKKYPPPVLPK